MYTALLPVLTFGAVVAAIAGSLLDPVRPVPARPVAGQPADRRRVPQAAARAGPQGDAVQGPRTSAPSELAQDAGGAAEPPGAVLAMVEQSGLNLTPPEAADDRRRRGARLGVWSVAWYARAWWSARSGPSWGRRYRCSTSR